MYHKLVVLSQIMIIVFMIYVDFSTEEWKSRFKYLSNFLPLCYLASNGIRRLLWGR